MNIGNISDQLPTYPPNIQGELRVILQTKDIFLLCYKQLEEYRRLVNEQNRLITKEFVQEQLQIGEDEITELNMELQDAESKLAARLRHNELLAEQLTSMGFGSIENGGSVRHMALVRSPQMRKNMLAQRKAAFDGGSCSQFGNRSTHMIDNISLAIDEIQKEVRVKVKPLLDYYRDLFYLQLHFSLILGQVCNYCMPLVTENIGLIDRIFFWSERPEFDLVRRSGDISDRLKEIYTRAQTILGVLSESVRFLQSKVELQKNLESRFHERLDEQQKCKDKILREIHNTKQSMDMLEEENDRLVGSLVKVDPTFVDSQHFAELADSGQAGQRSKTPPAHPVNNANEDNHLKFEHITENSNASFACRATDRHESKWACNSDETDRINPSKDYNNNKSRSTLSDFDGEGFNIADRTDLTSKAQTKPENHEKNKKRGSKKKTSNCLFDYDINVPVKDQNLKGNTTNIGIKYNNKVNDIEEEKKSTRRSKIKRSATVIGRQDIDFEILPGRNKSRHRRSTSRTQSPPKARIRGRSIERKFKNDINSAKEYIAGKNVSEERPHSEAKICATTNKLSVPGTSLKSRLLDRTRGLLDSARQRVGKNISLTSDESKGYLEYGLPHNISEGEGEIALTSVSSFTSTSIPDHSGCNQDLTDDQKWRNITPRNQSFVNENKEVKNNKKKQKYKKKPQKDKIDHINNKSGIYSNELTEPHHSKYQHGRNVATVKEPVEYHMNSSSDNLPSTDGSIIHAI